jgi:hypothetical protein
MTVTASVLKVRSLSQCPEHPKSGSSALSVISGPKTVALDLTIFMSVGIVTLMKMMIWYLNTDI